MEDKWRITALTAIAPAAWGSNYYVAQHFLPPDRPLFSAVVRALPVGLVLLAVTRQLPRADWWWRAAVLGTLNVGGFFVLIYVAADRLPGGLASTLMATSPAVMMLLALPLLGERLRVLSLVGAAAGFVGVLLLLRGGDGSVDLWGVVASLTAMTASSLGFVLGKRWRPPVPMLTFTAWQLVAGGLVVLPVALLVEGGPPSVGPTEVGGYLYTCLVATALAYVVWFRGLQRLPAGTVALIGLLNPVVGVALGATLAGEPFGAPQLVGGALVLAGILLGQLRSTPRPSAPVVRELAAARS
ncbi:EamA family transporter [Angustibacter peucedani]